LATAVQKKTKRPRWENIREGGSSNDDEGSGKKRATKNNKGKVNLLQGGDPASRVDAVRCGRRPKKAIICGGSWWGRSSSINKNHRQKNPSVQSGANQGKREKTGDSGEPAKGELK